MVGLFNLSTLTARQNLNKTDDQSRVTVERLSTGKINNGPAGRKVADFITSVALRNDENSYKAILDSLPRATSVLQTADGAGQQISAITARLKDLSYRATSSGSNVERQALQLEFAKLTEEIDRISTTANFNGTKLLDGTLDTASKLNSDRRLNEVTSSLNVGSTALDGGQIVINRGDSSNTLSVNYINDAELALFIQDFNNGIAAGDFAGYANDASAFAVNLTLGGVVFENAATAPDLSNASTGTTFRLYTNGADTTNSASITFTLKQTQDFNLAGSGDNFVNKLVADLTNVKIDQKDAFSIKTSDLGTEYFSISVADPFGVSIAAGSTGDINLVGSLETINVSGTFTNSTAQDVSLLINGKAYVATAVDLANDVTQTIAFVNAQTGTTITLTKNAISQTALANQSDLDDLLKKLKNDLDGVTVYQARQIGSGSLDQFKPGVFDGTQLDGIDGFDFELTTSSYGIINENDQSSKPTTPVFEGFRVGAETAATDGYVSVVINGETFRTPDGFFDGKSTNLRDSLPNGKLVLTNTKDSAETFVIDLSRATSTGINTDSDLSARGLEDALNKVFNTTRETKLSFQVGLDVADKISLNIGGLTTDDLFKNADGQTRVLDISTIGGANEAINVLTLANEKVSSALAEITSAFARFENVKESVRTAIKNLSEARDPIENADIAEESSKYAELQVLRDVATAVLTTENQKNRSLSRLIG